MMIDRRSLILGAGSVAALAGHPALARAARGPQLRTIGLQLYTLRELFAADPVATLEKVARVGYREVEYGGGNFETMDHRMLRDATDRFGLKAPSVHIGYDMLLSDFDAAAAMARTLGADTIVLPYLTKEHRAPDIWRATLANINRLARQAKDSGLGFAYHNHNFEFTEMVDGMSLYDMMMKVCDPQLVKVELDLFWAVYAGQDPMALIRKLAGRVYSYHVKDMGADRKMTSVGLGTIDFTGIFKLNALSGVKHFYVENDVAPPPYLPDITKSFATLSTMRF